MAAALTRRDAVAFAAIWASLPAVAQAAPADGGLGWTPTALTPAQASTLDAVAEAIMPRTDTPGARELGVPQFVDRALASWSTPADAAAVRRGLDRVEADARAAHGAGFAALTAAQQTALLERYDAEGRGPKTPPAGVGRGETETGLSNAPRAAVEPPKGPFFFAVLKDLVTVGYFTSKVGSTEVVRWDPSPGAYHGSVPLKEIGRAWAL